MAGYKMYGVSKTDGTVTLCRAKDPANCPYHTEGSHKEMTENQANEWNEHVAAENAAGERALSKAKKPVVNIVAEVMDSRDRAAEVNRVRNAMEANRRENYTAASRWLSEHSAGIAEDAMVDYNDCVENGGAPESVRRTVSRIELSADGKNDPRHLTARWLMDGPADGETVDHAAEAGFLVGNMEDVIDGKRRDFDEANVGVELSVGSRAAYAEAGDMYEQPIVLHPSPSGEAAQAFTEAYSGVEGRGDSKKYAKYYRSGDDVSVTLENWSDDGYMAETTIDYRDGEPRSAVVALKEQGGSSYHQNPTTVVRLGEPSGDMAFDACETAKRVDEATRKLAVDYGY